MASSSQNTYEGFLASFKITVHLTSSKLTIGAEHRQTKKIYRTEIDEDAVINITHGVCEKREHLFHLLQELIDHDGKCSNKNLDVVEQETKLLLQLTLTVSLGRASRQFVMDFQLNSMQLDDVTRLENIINELAQRVKQLEMHTKDCFDHATELWSLHENKLAFRSLTPESVSLTENDCTMRCQAIVNDNYNFNSFGGNYIIKKNTLFFPSSFPTISTIGSGAAPLGSAPPFSFVNTAPFFKLVVVWINQSFLLSINKRYQLVRFHLYHPNAFHDDDLLYVGVTCRPENKDYSNVISSTDTWLFNVIDGTIQHAPFSSRSYTWSLKPMDLQVGKATNATSDVDLLFDAELRRIAFRIGDESEDRWAFNLPKELQISQLYPLVILKSATMSVSIDDNNSMLP